MPTSPEQYELFTKKAPDSGKIFNQEARPNLSGHKNYFSLAIDNWIKIDPGVEAEINDSDEKLERAVDLVLNENQEFSNGELPMAFFALVNLELRTKSDREFYINLIKAVNIITGPEYDRDINGDVIKKTLNMIKILINRARGQN